MIIIKTLPLLMVAGLSLISCNSSSDLTKVKNASFLNAGITIYEPMDYFDEDGETITGFDAELANKFADSLGIKTSTI